MSTNTIQYKTNGVFYNNEKLLTQADSSNLSVTTVSPIAPVNPTSGSMWLDTTNSTSPILNVYNGTEWKQASSSGTTTNPIYTGTTTNATPTEIFIGGVANNRYSVPDNSAITFEYTVSARDMSNGDAGGYKITGIVKRYNGGSAILVALPSKQLIAEDQTGIDAEITVLGNDLILTVTGTTNTVNWTSTTNFSAEPNTLPTFGMSVAQPAFVLNGSRVSVNSESMASSISNGTPSTAVELNGLSIGRFVTYNTNLNTIQRLQYSLDGITYEDIYTVTYTTNREMDITFIASPGKYRVFSLGGQGGSYQYIGNSGCTFTTTI